VIPARGEETVFRRPAQARDNGGVGLLTALIADAQRRKPVPSSGDAGSGGRKLFTTGDLKKRALY